MKCWLGFHNWGKWSEVKPAIITYEVSGRKFDITAQERYCKTCNKREMRRAN